MEEQPWKSWVQSATDDLRQYSNRPLIDKDRVMVMQAYNKALAFRTAFMDGLFIYWRLLCCYAVKNHSGATPQSRGLAPSSVSSNGTSQRDDEKVQIHPMRLVEAGADPLAACLGERIQDAPYLLWGMIDAALRTLCPHVQEVAREAYRPLRHDQIIARHLEEEGGSSDIDSSSASPYPYSKASTLECETLHDYFKLFARLGVRPEFWVKFVAAFVWAFQTHGPYVQDYDLEDLERGPDSALARAAAQTIALPAIRTYQYLLSFAEQAVCDQHLPRIWNNMSLSDRYKLTEKFYQDLLTDHPPLMDVFSRSDLDSLVAHQAAALTLVLTVAVKDFGRADSRFRRAVDHLATVHRHAKVPTYGYPLVGAHLLDCFQPLFEAEEKATANTDHPFTAKELHDGFLTVYAETMSMVYYPMHLQEKLLAEARSFYEVLQVELGWSDGHLQKRMVQIEQEVNGTGTYTQTHEEIQMGARLAWRNAQKCCGRIAWNTLDVIDCRHMTTPEQIFSQVERHLMRATAGTNIQSTMTIFPPKSPKEPFGTRWLTSQMVRYACYKDAESGKLMGDVANLHVTEYLIKNNYWTPPEPKTPFDILPIVLKVPGQDKPYIHQLPKECIFEVPIEHPTCPEISALGYRWTTVPGLFGLKLNLGGVVYQNIPFNGWFLSTEIVRNLMERYGAAEPVAKALGLDTQKNRMFRQRASIELEQAVLFSFEKHGFTIVDPMTVGEQYCTHFRREMELGRECPAQWSWIGGLLGPTNPTWHLEMRDFVVKPQYDYAAEDLALHTAIESLTPQTSEVTRLNMEPVSSSIPRVLIAFGSETGFAESVARRLKRQLAVLKPTLVTLNEAAALTPAKKRSFSHLICVCSTFGKGEAPVNAANFFTSDVGDFSKGKFAVLAIGSSLYPDFCKAGTTLDMLLAKTGIERMASLVKADDAAGAESVVSVWLAMTKTLLLPPHLETVYASMVLMAGKVPKSTMKWTQTPEPAASSARSGDMSLCLENVELLGGNSSRSVRRIVFETPSTYESGDHLAVQPINQAAMVKRFLLCFEYELGRAVNDIPGAETFAEREDMVDWIAKQPFELEYDEGDGQRYPADVFFTCPTTLEYLAGAQLDLSMSCKHLEEVLLVADRCLKMELDNLDQQSLASILADPLVQEFHGIVQSCINEEVAEKKQESVEGAVASFPTVIHFLEHFHRLLLIDSSALVGKTSQVGGPILPLAELLMVMPRLHPRYYSISSSNQVSPQQVSVSVGLLKTETTKGVPVEGVCSHYLCSLKPGQDRAFVSIKKSTFRLPSDHDATILMVAAGTGLAPFMGFLADIALARNENKDAFSQIHLAFGCRTDDDFIYEKEIREYEESGVLQLHLALSRSAKQPKQYVQDKLREMGATLSDALLRDNTYYYVCGDAVMADGAREVCVDVLRSHAKMSRVHAVNHLTRMRVEDRWQSDVWGILSHYEDAKKSVEKARRQAAKVWLSHFSSQ